jgi:hypothetical protein
MTDNIVTKSAVSVTEMARMVGLSRARFYQLVRRGTFPPADQDSVTGRPCYFEEKQRQILEVRRRNCGVDGRPLLFYSRRRDLGQPKAAPRPGKPKAKINQYADLIDHLEGVNVFVTVAQVEGVVKEKFPNGIDGKDPTEVFLAVHERLQRQNSPGSG